MFIHYSWLKDSRVFLRIITAFFHALSVLVTFCDIHATSARELEFRLLKPSSIEKSVISIAASRALCILFFRKETYEYFCHKNNRCRGRNCVYSHFPRDDILG